MWFLSLLLLHSNSDEQLDNCEIIDGLAARGLDLAVDSASNSGKDSQVLPVEMEPGESSEPDKTSLRMENLFPTVTWKDRIRASFRKRDSDSNEDSHVTPKLGYPDFTVSPPDEWDESDEWDEWKEPYDKEERISWQRTGEMERWEEEFFAPDDPDERLARLREAKARLDQKRWKENPGFVRKMLEWIETQRCAVFARSFVPPPSVRFGARGE
jgi:hypothetical protein